MAIDESLECPHHLKALLASKKGVRQVEKHVAVDHFCRTTRKPLAHPYRGQSTRDGMTHEPFVKTFANPTCARPFKKTSGAVLRAERVAGHNLSKW